MFTVEELSLIKSYLDASQDRSTVITGLEAALPDTDSTLRPELEDLVVRLQQISDAEFAKIDFDDLMLEDADNRI